MRVKKFIFSCILSGLSMHCFAGDGDCFWQRYLIFNPTSVFSLLQYFFDGKQEMPVENTCCKQNFIWVRANSNTPEFIFLSSEEAGYSFHLELSHFKSMPLERIFLLNELWSDSGKCYHPDKLLEVFIIGDTEQNLLELLIGALYFNHPDLTIGEFLEWGDENRKFIDDDTNRILLELMNTPYFRLHQKNVEIEKLRNALSTIDVHPAEVPEDSALSKQSGCYLPPVTSFPAGKVLFWATSVLFLPLGLAAMPKNQEVNYESFGPFQLSSGVHVCGNTVFPTNQPCPPAVFQSDPMSADPVNMLCQHLTTASVFTDQGTCFSASPPTNSACRYMPDSSVQCRVSETIHCIEWVTEGSPPVTSTLSGSNG